MKRLSVFLFALLLFAVAVPSWAQGQRRHAGRKLLQKMDMNHDGQISRAEWTRKPKAFDRLDLNHDGMLSVEELKNRRRK